MPENPKVIGTGSTAVRVSWDENACELRTCDHIVRGNKDFGSVLRAWANNEPYLLVSEFEISIDEASEQIAIMCEELRQQGVALP